MKKFYFLVIGIYGLLASCSNPNKVFIDKISDHINDNVLGVDLNYKSIDFKLTNTVFVKDSLQTLNKEMETSMKEILGFKYYIQDDFKEGNIYTKGYITPERLLELRNWELNVGHPNEKVSGRKAIWEDDGFKDYYEFAFANRNASAFISELCNQVQKTDSLLKVYDKIKEGDLELIKNANWYYKRIDKYGSGDEADKNGIFKGIVELVGELEKSNTTIDSLSKLDPNSIIAYKALNTYQINNPLLNGAEQKVTKYFMFNSNFNITAQEDYKK